MRGKNFLKYVLWNGIFRKIPGHPRKSVLGKLRSWLGRKMITKGYSSSVFAPLVEMRGFDVRIGKNSGIGYSCLVMTGDSYIEIGDGVTMGPRIMLICISHRFYEENGEWKEERLGKPIVIGDECFIGAGAIILQGVKIGRRSIIGAGSVVTKNIPANSFVAGQPARVIRSTKKEV